MPNADSSLSGSKSRVFKASSARLPGLFWLYLAIAVINLVAAFTAGPAVFGWAIPDGLSGAVGGIGLAAVLDMLSVRYDEARRLVGEHELESSR